MLGPLAAPNPGPYDAVVPTPRSYCVADLQARLQVALGPGYRVEHELGGGGMSRVFLAQEGELGRQVVVKVLPPGLRRRAATGGAPEGGSSRVGVAPESCGGGRADRGALHAPRCTSSCLPARPEAR